MSRPRCLRSVCATLIAVTALFLPTSIEVSGQEAKPAATALDDGATATAESPAVRTNRLSRESSPYLLLHQHNPVDWYAWGPEAFEKAKAESKPIFLSVGYSSCYWCHVMERLVFSNEKIAAYMNEHFVNVKVDREERPDLDDIYMTSVIVYFQVIGSPQGGGWPLSVFLTPEGKPFAGGTYFPPDDNGGRLGFGSVLQRVHALWTDQRDAIHQNADTLTVEVQRLMQPKSLVNPVAVDRALYDRVVASMASVYDAEFGGLDFSAARPESPKFPVPSKLALLLYDVGRSANAESARMVYHTLDRIADGGIHDHLAGGFHRYSTDRRWHVPHFEKMLYDQSQLADAFTQAWAITKKPEYRAAAEGIFTWVLGDMTDPAGGFYSALDAETNHIEGEHYVWTREEIDNVLGPDDGALFARAYGLTRENPFEHGFVLHRSESFAAIATETGVPLDEINGRLMSMRTRLLAVRDKRELPLRDDKVLASWNGLMIQSLARAGTAFDRADLLQAAETAADFVLTQMRDDNGNLHRSWRNDAAHLNGYLDDYAFVASGLLALGEATGNKRWTIAARELVDRAIRDFHDADAGGFYFTAGHHEALIARTRSAYDAVLPSGNSMMVRNLVRLHKLTGQPQYLELAGSTLSVFAGGMQESPTSLAQMAIGLSEYLDAKPATQAPDASSRRAAEAPLFNTGDDVVMQTSFRIVPGLEAVVGAPPTGAKSDEPPKPKYVAGKAYLSVDKLPAGGRCQILVVLKINEGWHINANPPNPDFLVPTTFTVKSRYATKLTTVRYPRASALEVDGFDEKFHVLEGQVAIRGILEIPAAAAGHKEELDLTINFQCCNDKRCLRPEKLVLKGKLDVARPGEPIQQVNANLFRMAEEKKPTTRR